MIYEPLIIISMIITYMKTGLKRDTIDKFYTKPDIARSCIDKIREHVRIREDLIIEPSCGNGTFIEPIKSLSGNYKFYDILPDHPEAIKQDYLVLPNPEERVHVVGNPPFGKNSSLAIKFIKKSSEFAKTISFILPKSFKKESMRKAFPLCYHLVYEEDLPQNSFLVDDIDHDVPCVFQIWKKKSRDRETPDKLEPIGFSFVKKSDDHDISVRRVGVYAGVVSVDTDDKSEQSHYFIKLVRPPDDTLLQNLNDLVFETDNTVGPRSIGKQEMIAKYNPILA